MHTQQSSRPDANAPLVSVVIPAYNSGIFIEECLKSVLAQTHQPVEAVVVDDGSTDDTAERARAFGDPVRVIAQPNRGRGAARQAAVEAARAEFIAFMDHDDLLTPESVAVRLRYLQDHPDIAWVCTDAVEFEGDKDLRRYLARFTWLDPEGDAFTQILRGVFPLTSTVLARREAIARAGGFPNVRYGEDIVCFLRLALITKPGIIREPLTRRRSHPDQGNLDPSARWSSRVELFGSFDPGDTPLNAEQKRALEYWRRHACFKLGEYHWERNQGRKARANFGASLGWNRWTPAAVTYSLVSRLPGSWIRAARDGKNGFKRALGRG